MEDTQLNTQVLNRMEELDILLLDRNGFPVAFSKNFSKLIDNYMPIQDRDIEFGKLIKSLFKQYTKHKKFTNRERYRMYYQIIAELLVIISRDDEINTCEEYRLKVVNQLDL